MAEEQKKMVPTLGLTGVTVNAMALIAPGAFLWITFVQQAGYAFPSGMAMWAGIFVALMLAYATAISYAELAKLYPGAGSSYLFAEQAFLSKTHAYKFARVAKFVIGWSSHLYYWMYPGVMVATMGIMIGYIVGTVAPSTMNAGIPGPVFMAIIAIIFAYAVAWIAFRGVNGSTHRQYRDQRSPDRRVAVLLRRLRSLTVPGIPQARRAWRSTPMATRSLRPWALRHYRRPPVARQRTLGHPAAPV